jgi:hypothetical protein
MELSTVNFGEAELEASFKKSGKITQPPDVNNLVRFVQDALKKTFHVNCAQLTKTAQKVRQDHAASGCQQSREICPGCIQENLSRELRSAHEDS